MLLYGSLRALSDHNCTAPSTDNTSPCYVNYYTTNGYNGHAWQTDPPNFTDVSSTDTYYKCIEAFTDVGGYRSLAPKWHHRSRRV